MYQYNPMTPSRHHLTNEGVPKLPSRNVILSAWANKPELGRSAVVSPTLTRARMWLARDALRQRLRDCATRLGMPRRNNVGNTDKSDLATPHAVGNMRDDTERYKMALSVGSLKLGAVTETSPFDCFQLPDIPIAPSQYGVRRRCSSHCSPRRGKDRAVQGHSKDHTQCRDCPELLPRERRRLSP